MFAPEMSPDIDASDFDAAAKVLFEMADFIEDVAVPLTVVKEIARRDMAERFETEIAPNGRAWAALNPDYETWKQEEHGDLPILTLTGDLRNKATSEGAWSVSGDSVWFSTASLPIYWSAHQYGVQDWSFTPESGPRTGEYIELFGKLTPRPFIGLSEEAENEILAYMDGWFEFGISEGVRHYEEGARVMSGSAPGILTAPIGKQYRVAGAGFGGRFGPKV